MSEREPITAELRELMGGVEPRVDEDGVVTAKYVTPDAWGEFVRRCDAIDAVHAALERENAELRERVAVLDNRSDSMHIGGATVTITDELRKYANDAVKRDDYMGGLSFDLMRIADRIDAEHQKAIRELNNLADASVLLPVDADGEIIHVGDMMERGKARGHVIALMLSEYPKKWGGGLHWGVQLEGEQAPTALDLTFHHYHEQTVEDVLTKFGIDWEYEDNCEDRAALLAEYASKLRLAEGEDA